MDCYQQDQVFPFVIRKESTPHIAEKIFQSLDQNAMKKCRLVSHVWKGFIDCHTTLWGKVPTDLYIRAAKEGRLNVCRLIIQNNQNKNPADDDNNTPLHSAAEEGNLEICRLIIENVQDKNPANRNGDTPLHKALGAGHLEVCRLIIENIQDKNPANRNYNSWSFGDTPLHYAAMRGHLEICRLIIKNVPHKNPAGWAHCDGECKQFFCGKKG